MNTISKLLDLLKKWRDRLEISLLNWVTKEDKKEPEFIPEPIDPIGRWTSYDPQDDLREAFYNYHPELRSSYRSQRELKNEFNNRKISFK